jgi:hypothetical protein
MWGNSMKKDSWGDVRISCEKPSGWHHPEDPPIKYESPRFVTEMKVKQMMKDHFPDGPRAAKRAQRAHWEWETENWRRSWHDRTPQNKDARRWEVFFTKVLKWTMDEEERGVAHGYFDYMGADFGGLDRRRRRGRSM